MSDDSSTNKNLNAFNTIIRQLLSMDIKITKDHRGIRLLCYFLDS
jgi:hypothetical protein